MSSIYDSSVKNELDGKRVTLDGKSGIILWHQIGKFGHWRFKSEGFLMEMTDEQVASALKQVRANDES